MKTIIKIASFIFFGAILINSMGCKKELEAKDFSDLTPANFFQTDADLNSAIIALLNPFECDWGTTDLGSPNGTGKTGKDGAVWYSSLYNSDRKSYLARSIITTDEIPKNVWDADLQNFTWGPATYSLLTGTESTYAKIRFVARATELISKIPAASKATSFGKAKYMAEAKTMRAWLMYVLYDFFGPVNVILDPSKLNSTVVTPRPSKEDYCAQIEQDLKDALATPSSIFLDSYNGIADSWGRPSKGLARMLLLKLYMHNRQWAKAEAAAKDIMDMSIYSLLPYYPDVFNISKNMEVIYAVPSSADQRNCWIPALIPGDFDHGVVGKFSLSGITGWYGYYMPWSYFDKFDTSDTRRATIMSSYVKANGKVKNRSNGMLGAMPLKYTDLMSKAVPAPYYAVDVVVFRYAEVLLSRAEAINEQRGPAEAYQYVDSVRSRASHLLVKYQDLNLSKEALRDSLLVERGRELYCEGQRRQDLIRHGKFIEYALQRGLTDASLKDTLFPIPSSVIIEGKGIIIQNPGY